MVNLPWGEKIRGLVRLLRPWVDPISYRPLILLAAVSFGAMLLPLAIDVAVALFFGLPHVVQKAVGQGLLLSLIALGIWRLWQVGPGDPWPEEGIGRDGGPRSLEDRWIPWALRLAVVSLAYPLLQHPDGLGFADWDFVLDKFEAVRRTILVWGQFPWWHPWCRGGFPLAAEPQIGAVSIATPLVLALGTSVGLRVATIVYLWVAVEGAYRLGRLWFRDPWASAATALIYGLNGAVLINVSQGYILAMSYWLVPWLAYHAFRLGERLSDGVLLGAWMALAVLTGIQYVTLYSVPFVGLIWLRNPRVRPPSGRTAVLVHTVAGVGTFLLLCGWRLGTMFLVLLDDKRERVTYWDETPATMLHYLLYRPKPTWPKDFYGTLNAVFIDLTCYVGPIVLLLFVASLLRGWRWWHTLALAGFWLALGSVRWYQPSYWLADWPLFGSAHVVPRWRIIGLLGIALAAGSVLARWRRSNRWALRALAPALVLIIAADLVSLGHEQFPLAFSVRPVPEAFPGPPVPEIVNVRDGLGFPCVQRGYGVIRGYEPMLSYRRDAPTLRRAREDPDYRGEAWTDAGRVEPTFWSPNRIVFQVEPGQEVHVNQNPGSWWWANGRPAFPGRPCAELMTPFVARADARGHLELSIHPRGLAAGAALHALGLVLLIAASLTGRYLRRE